VHVRRCRTMQGGAAARKALNASTSHAFTADGTHLLCGCAQTETALVNNRTRCDAARSTVCSGSSVDVVSSAHMLSLCSACLDPSRGMGSSDCQTQTIRAVSLLTSRGLCSPSTGPNALPVMDCSSETVTEPGREGANYLSLRPPMLYGSVERSGNSFGAYGWYHTPRLA
jgi:hypothetical protein